MTNRNSSAAGPGPGPLADVLRMVGEALRDLRYGQVVIQVHGGSVVQIERTEKTRPSPPPTVGGAPET
jgi:hypothetical protein